MSELAIRVARTAAGRLSDRIVWQALADWRDGAPLPAGFQLRRGNYGRKIGPRAWLRYVAEVTDDWRPGRVLCDYDRARRPNLDRVWQRLRKARLRPAAYRLERTRRGWHLIIELQQQLTLPETIALQALLGSDPHREAFNLARAIGLRRKPSQFWETRANILYGRKLTWQEQHKALRKQQRRARRAVDGRIAAAMTRPGRQK